MALANSRVQLDPPSAPDGVYALIERSFFGVGEIHPSNLVQTAFLHHFGVRGGGSRIRLTRQCVSALGIEDRDGICLASAVECLHNASLVQDDLQDNSRLRRGQASVAAKFGRDVALSLTDQLITTAFVCLSRVSQPGKLPFLISRINHAVSETVEGQTCELSGSLDGSSVERYLNAARKKSGPLFALSLELPLIFARHAEFLELAHEAACQFGLGYQILDDLKDQVSDLPGERSGNVVFALQKTDGSHSAEAKAAVMAQGFLQEASDRAESLPHDCGRSLIELVQILTPQIDAFTS